MISLCANTRSVKGLPAGGRVLVVLERGTVHEGQDVPLLVVLERCAAYEGQGVPLLHWWGVKGLPNGGRALVLLGRVALGKGQDDLMPVLVVAEVLRGPGLDIVLAAR